ncbi:23S rRNA (pseudouridine(1915)-N(3))-methyltransferase RlmH [Flavobacterium aurantiibacter]|uniref:Ribosomal RNA large subunit methyltransferase H n=1 Tax=Flavobacterium aurantiibacter TaxID=2023067 RepID=A0A255ZSD7_9FLAO|nr:23S rRNA (pseudouridine(1915)-N(3))-methyltransferase RlmH [Flavobacterium aurantiibacter]OYQ44418.1 23S rRNA (pseudouridine(1915)-N(3))-methyltransferase RlmH [Flavobacterium aurantiibacter]
MTLKLMAVGKTDDKQLEALTDRYVNRLKHYIKFEIDFLADIKNVKNLSEAQQKEKEGQLILAKVANTDFLVLLDERGKSFSSEAFAEYLQQRMNSGVKNLIFVIGGPYGFSEAVYERANAKVSLSAMTFSHQMIRLFVVEQLYRGFTILRNEPYHHG